MFRSRPIHKIWWTMEFINHIRLLTYKLITFKNFPLKSMCDEMTWFQFNSRSDRTVSRAINSKLLISSIDWIKALRSVFFAWKFSAVISASKWLIVISSWYINIFLPRSVRYMCGFPCKWFLFNLTNYVLFSDLCWICSIHCKRMTFKSFCVNFTHRVG